MKNFLHPSLQRLTSKSRDGRDALNERDQRPAQAGRRNVRVAKIQVALWVHSYTTRNALCTKRGRPERRGRGARLGVARPGEVAPDSGGRELRQHVENLPQRARQRYRGGPAPYARLQPHKGPEGGSALKESRFTKRLSWWWLCHHHHHQRERKGGQGGAPAARPRPARRPRTQTARSAPTLGPTRGAPRHEVV
jgi:hypothetical protein